MQQEEDFGRNDASIQEKQFYEAVPVSLLEIVGMEPQMDYRWTTDGQWARQSPGKSGSRLVIMWRRPRRLATKVENVNGC
jgi:hypothetical protein